MGLVPMIEDVIKRVRAARKPRYEFGPLNVRDHRRIATTISVLEGADSEGEAAQESNQIRRALGRAKHQAPVVGITGTGGAGKSSLSDELLSRFVRHFPDRQIAVVAIDPTRRRSGGALLGDRIRMNSLANEQIFMRSLATRRQHLATSRGAEGRDRAVPARGLRPDLRRDRRHRPVGHRDRRRGGPVAVRHDQRLRRGEPAREDRHARLRRHGRAQQVREARRRGQPAVRAQAVAAQSSGAHADPGRTTCRCSRRSRAASTIRA